MRDIIKTDLLDVLKKAIEYLKKEDLSDLAELSNHTIHDASIFQDEDSVSLAITIYSLAKVLQRCKEQNKTCPLLVNEIEQAYNSLSNGKENEYRIAMRNVLQEISAHDSQVKLYIQEVVQKAKIKKASKLHEHGISIARTAELLGISQWELQTYIGNVAGETLPTSISVSERLRQTRELFK